jgi:hypothetical protein
MTTRTERRQRQLDTLTITGLIALAIGSLAEAVRVTGVELGWINEAAAGDRILLLTGIVGLVVFGLAFSALWWTGRRLSPQEREALGDELRLFLNRKNAIVAFVATYLTAVMIATIPAAADLPGRAVALVIITVATATLVVGRIASARS